jgi:hypothetical protein
MVRVEGVGVAAQSPQHREDKQIADQPPFRPSGAATER